MSEDFTLADIDPQREIRRQLAEIITAVEADTTVLTPERRQMWLERLRRCIRE
jgi:hypothetical protein